MAKLFVILLLCIVGVYSQDCTARPHLGRKNGCCKINFTPQQSDCVQKVHQQWDRFHESDNKDSFVKTSDMCLANCFFNNTNILTPDNKINVDGVKPILETFFGTEWQSSLQIMLNTCKDHADNVEHHGNGKAHHSLMASCSMPAEKLFFCLREQALLSCPQSLWENNNECNELRTYLKNCPFSKRGLPPHKP